jgi:hypothetical protein
MKNEMTKELTVELESGKTFEIEVTATGVYDSNYGADADGNRGMALWFLDEVAFDLPKTDEDGNILTIDELHELDVKLNKLALDEDWEWSLDNDREYEPEMEEDFNG